MGRENIFPTENVATVSGIEHVGPPTLTVAAEQKNDHVAQCCLLLNMMCSCHAGVMLASRETWPSQSVGHVAGGKSQRIRPVKCGGYVRVFGDNCLSPACCLNDKCYPIEAPLLRTDKFYALPSSEPAVGRST